MAFFSIRDEVTRAIIVLFVGGQVTNVQQNKQLTTNFPSHKSADVWMFLQLLYASVCLYSFSRRLIVFAASLDRLVVVVVMGETCTLQM